jgi:hypothetical protein
MGPDPRQITEPLVEGSLIILFVNKLDKLYSIDDGAIERINALFDPLVQILSGVAGTHLKVVIGAASVGMGIAGSDFGDENQIPPVTLYSELVRIAG